MTNQQPINRRDFLKILGSAVTASVLSGCNRSTPPPPPTATYAVGLSPTAAADTEVLEMANRPNIVFLMVDDLDGILGTPDFMPHLKSEITEQGVTFEQFCITSPVCCPSRATFLRGQYTHNHGTLRNRPPHGGFEQFNLLENEASTVATWLQSAGYQTAFMGKYMNGYPWKDAKRYIPAGWSEWISAVVGKPYYGFNYTFNENGNFADYGNEPQDYLTDVLTEKAKDFINRAVQNPDPFFLYVTPFMPHGPYIPAPRHERDFLDIQAPRTGSFNAEIVSQKPPHIRDDAPLTEEQIQEIDEVYRMRVQAMQSIDEMIASLVETLKQNDVLENTYIFFTSDNGYHMGQHRQPPGKDLPYEEDIRVPFIVRGPGIAAGQVIQEYLTCNVDFAPTVAELAGVIPPKFVDGRSLTSLFGPEKPSPENWRKAVPLEFYPHKVSEGSDPTIPSYLGARTENYLFTEYEHGFREFYDLNQDPDQLHNLASEKDPTEIETISNWLKYFFQSEGQALRDLEDSFPNI